MAAGGKGLLDRKSGAVSERQLQYALRIAEFPSPKGTLDCVTAFGRTDFRGDVAEVTVPTLVIHGDSDAIVPFEVSGKRSHELIADSELVVIEGGPHGINTPTPRVRRGADPLPGALTVSGASQRAPASEERTGTGSAPMEMARQGVRTPATRARRTTGAAGPRNCVVDPPVVSDVWFGRMP